MIDHIVKRHVSLRTPSGAKAPPVPRTLGDSPAWNDAEAEIRPEGPLEPAPFLQAMAQWKIEGPSKPSSRPLPTRDENPSSLD
jgi:hypothetical protein